MYDVKVYFELNGGFTRTKLPALAPTGGLEVLQGNHVNGPMHCHGRASVLQQFPSPHSSHMVRTQTSESASGQSRRTPIARLKMSSGSIRRVERERHQVRP